MPLRDRVHIHGAGKVGRALAAALKSAGAHVTLRAARKGFSRRPLQCDLLVLAVRDRDLQATLSALIESDSLQRACVVVHVAGALYSDALAAIRPHCAGVAQMHPMISFASTRVFPQLARGNMHIEGDAAAVARARRVARALGMTPRSVAGLDPVAYHAAAGLVANGAAALAAVGADVLVAAGIDRADAPKLLGPLLRSVADNIERLGFPDALTGPVRRGDAAAVDRAYQLLARRVPHAAPLFAAAVSAQLPLAKALGEAPAQSWAALAQWAAAHGSGPLRARR